MQARLVEGRRKTHQPAGERLAAEESDADALRQRLNRAYLAEWDDQEVRGRLRQVAQQALPDSEFLVVDDTGLLKSGTKSPGVQRQYTGTAGKVANCQLVVSTHLASWTNSTPLQMDVYLPKSWCDDPVRCKEAGIPADVAFRTKPAIAADQIDGLVSQGVPATTVLADSAFGDNAAFRQRVREAGLAYAVGISSDFRVWRAGEGPGERTLCGEWEAQPLSVLELADELPPDSWERVDLRPGAKNPRRGRFASVRVRTAQYARQGKPPGEEEWLVVEWPADKREPFRYFLCALPAETPLPLLARTCKHRWVVEHDYRDAKQEVGLDQYEGRRWVGLTHHLTICLVAMTYLAALQRLSPHRT